MPRHQTRSEKPAPLSDLSFRQLEVRASTLSVEERSIEATISTETPVPMPDWERGEMVNEILLTSGAEYPRSRQVPLLDCHSRWSVSSQLGSVRELAVNGPRMTGRLHFSAAAEGEWTKVREGHVTDVSVGYRVLKKVYVPAGKTKSIGGREFEGPLNLVTKWRIHEVSVTPIGADEQAKMRGLSPRAFGFLDKDVFTMNEELRALLVARGMPAELDDAAAQKWLLENRSALVDPPKEKAKPEGEGERKLPAPIPVAGTIDHEAIRKEAAEAARAAMREEREAQARHVGEIDALCQLADLPVEFGRSLHALELPAARAKILEEKKRLAADVTIAPRVVVTGEGRDRFDADLGTALVLRAMRGACDRPETIDKVFPVASRGKGHETFRHAQLSDLAREFVQSRGIDCRGLTREQIAICAMFGARAAGIHIREAAYHTTASFLNITLDAVNKSMMAGYIEAPSTWEGPMRRGESTPDFKTIHRVRLGAIPNLPVWPDNTDPEKASFADARESYGVEARSLQISFSHRLIVNDDMDAISKTPGMLGAAAKRTVNAVAWATLLANPTMSDGQPLFLETPTGNRFRSNYTVGAATPTVAVNQTMSSKMRRMRGDNAYDGGGAQIEGPNVLNLQQKYIAGPSTLETTINQLVNSAYDPAANLNMVHNPTRTLTPVIEPLLDDNSTTAWYTFASPQQIDTVEVTFLQGQEEPVVRDWVDQENLSQNFAVVQTCGAKVMNHRGIQKHKGAA